MSKTLEDFRENLGYTTKDVSRILNIGINALEHYEKQPADLPISLAVQIFDLYNIRFSQVKFN